MDALKKNSLRKPAFRKSDRWSAEKRQGGLLKLAAKNFFLAKS